MMLEECQTRLGTGSLKANLSERRREREKSRKVPAPPSRTQDETAASSNSLTKRNTDSNCVATSRKRDTTASYDENQSHPPIRRLMQKKKTVRTPLIALVGRGKIGGDIVADKNRGFVFWLNELSTEKNVPGGGGKGKTLKFTRIADACTAVDKREKKKKVERGARLHPWRKCEESEEKRGKKTTLR